MNCCLNTRIKLNINIMFFLNTHKNKNTANAYAFYEKYNKTTNNIMYIVLE